MEGGGRDGGGVGSGVEIVSGWGGKQSAARGRGYERQGIEDPLNRRGHIESTILVGPKTKVYHARNQNESWEM